MTFLPLFKLPISSSLHKKVLPNIFLLTSLLKSSSIDKSLIQNFFKSAIVLSVYPIRINKKMCIDKYEGVLRDYNFWYLTLVRKNSLVYIPTFKIYNMNIEIYN